MKLSSRGLFSGAVACAAIVLGGVHPVQAQAELSLGGGVGIPLGTYDDVVKMGWQGTAAVSFVPQGMSFGIQVDGSYAQFSDETPQDIKSQQIYGTVDLVYRLQSSAGSRLRPYIIGGGGVYTSKATGSDAPEGSSTKFGVNLGAGFDLKAGGAGLFLEGRWHNVLREGENVKFLPLTLGVRFGG